MDLNSSRKIEKRNLTKYIFFDRSKERVPQKQICGLLAFSQLWITWWCILFIHCCRDVCVCTFSHFSTQNVIIGQTWFILIGNRSKLEMSMSFQYLTGYKVKKYLKMLWPMWRVFFLSEMYISPYFYCHLFGCNVLPLSEGGSHTSIIKTLILERVLMLFIVGFH